MRTDKLVRLLLKAGRLPVVIDKKTFHSNLEDDGVCILDVASVKVQTIEMADGDGFTDWRKDGTARRRKCLILRGDS